MIKRAYLAGNAVRRHLQTARATRVTVVGRPEGLLATHSGQTAVSKAVSQSNQGFRELKCHKAAVGDLT
ncbi:hypothetical protein BC2230_120066 [Burkholderia cepacia]